MTDIERLQRQVDTLAAWLLEAHDRIERLEDELRDVRAVGVVPDDIPRPAPRTPPAKPAENHPAPRFKRGPREEALAQRWRAIRLA